MPISLEYGCRLLEASPVDLGLEAWVSTWRRWSLDLGLKAWVRPKWWSHAFGLRHGSQPDLCRGSPTRGCSWSHGWRPLGVDSRWWSRWVLVALG
uniref:Uncharacterized protein n=1 Tax=Fagus sylvatica TaxID=28930 RepID=A0A2N9J601_FAGSY